GRARRGRRARRGSRRGRTGRWCRGRGARRPAARAPQDDHREEDRAVIDSKTVQKLRAETGAGVMDCKRALEESKGDFEGARDLLRQKGLAAAAKRADRDSREGVVESYIHSGGRIGALVELSSETDFVARNPEFRELARNIAMQVAAMSPMVISEADLTAE